MAEQIFGRLTELTLQEAWKHEAHDFTPCLAENIEQLSKAVGMPLELVGTEVAVETFSDDILARSSIDGSAVLIESQLDTTDHKHLGQIMTYLAGLEAQTVIWVAPRFQEPHLSAIRWLNGRTADGFSFFAICVRAVRISDSLIAPVFEVVERPNDWKRQIRQKASTGEGASYYDIKHKFWTELLDRHPDLGEASFRVWRYPNNYVTFHDDPCVQLPVFIGKRDSGIFVCSGHSEPPEPVVELLPADADRLEQDLGASFAPLGRGDYMLMKKFPKGHEQKEAWPEIMDRMHPSVTQYPALATSFLP